MVIFATGQSKQKEMLLNISEMKLDEKERVIVNSVTYQTNNPKYFAAGDMISGGEEVVNAVADAKVAARGIDEYLKNKK